MYKSSFFKFQLLRSLIETIKNQRTVLRLSASTAISQILAFLVLPVITHIYAPQEYGRMTLFISASAILVSFSTLKLEVILSIQGNELDSKELVGGIFTLVFFISFMTLPFLLLLQWSLFEEGIDIWSSVFFVAIIILQSAVVVFTQLAFKHRRYKFVELAGPIQNSATSLLQFVFGLIKPNSTSLFLAFIFGRIAGLLPYKYEVRRYFSFCSLGKAVSVIRNYWTKSRYLFFASLYETFTAFLPILVISVVFSLNLAGYVGLIQSIMLAPTVLIGSTFASVLLAEISHSKNILELNHKEISSQILRIMKPLWVATALFIGFTIIIGPKVFQFIVNERWYGATILISWLAIPYGISMIWKSVVNVYIIQNQWREYSHLVLYSSLLSVLFGCIALIVESNWQVIVAAFIGGQSIGQAIGIIIIIKQLSTQSTKSANNLHE
jgi:O-antigen/teichoic acid export membrane protein